MILRAIITLTFLCVSYSSFAVCNISESEKSAAISKFWAVPEVINWKSYVLSHKGKKPIISKEIETETLKNKCFSKLSAYSDEGDHIHRWHDFYISQIGNKIYIDNTEGEFISLSKWRASPDGKAWRSNPSFKRDALTRAP
ncbi:hypothetical protein [Methylotenera sp.]|uniref:hypothetical protein n=1 Tax=Methylotenera sp. TaxID=2051956 RepID=UPI002ED81AAF